MKIYSLYRRQSLSLGVKEAWDFFTSPYHLNEITPDFFNIEITSQVPDKLYAGLMISYQMKAVLGIPMIWLSEISHCDEHKRFVYEQRVGPFKFLSHEVCINEQSEGVVVEDIMFYVMPLGWLGQLLHGGVIDKKMQAIFDTRRDYLQHKWGSKP